MYGRNRRAYSFSQFVFGIFLTAAFGLAAAPLSAGADDDAVIAKSLADMLRAARQVISNNQTRINDPNLGDKGLSGRVVLEQAVELYKKATGTDPASIDPASRHGRMVRRDIAIDISRRPSQPFQHRRHRPRRVHWMNLGELSTSSVCYLNSVTLITAPRSPSLPPSLG